MFQPAAVPLRVFTWRSHQMRSSRSVCGPSVLRRPAGLTSKLQTEFRMSRFDHGRFVLNPGFVQRRLGLSVLRRPARQPRHIEPTANSRSSVGVCSAWLAGRVQQNHQMQVMSPHIQARCLRSSSARNGRGTSVRCACVRQSPWPNTSVELTNCSKLQFAAHLER